MREIKFRGKGKETGKWVYGDLCCQCEVTGEPNIDCVAVVPDTVGQYTGLKDKNGVEIYEGDILDLHSMGRGVVCIGDFNIDYGSHLESFYGVYIRGEGQAYTDTLSWRDALGAEVVGNVHDTPEVPRAETSEK